MQFYKMEATENDFILTLNQKFTSIDIQRLCNRYSGIGADGLININNNRDITIYNQDGSTAAMCGNGLRCVAKLLHDLTQKNSFRVFIEGNPINIEYTYPYAKIIFEQPYFIKRKADEGYFVDVKNKHFVKIIDNVQNFVFDESIKEFVQYHQCNYEIVEIKNKNLVNLRIYEYGVGETKSCGSGAIATFFVLNEFLLVNDSIRIIVNGGELKVSKINHQYILEGDVTTIYKGEFLDVL